MNIADLVAALQQPLFTVLATPVSWTEVLGFGSGALCVWLVARQHIANWPTGIANNLFFILLFTQAGLYADAGLQLVFITLAVYGWWNWARRGSGAVTVVVRRTTRVEWYVLGVAGVAGLVGLTWLLDSATDSTVPFWDALTTVLSLLATYGQCRKRLESWWLWIAADVVYIPLYAYKGLYLTAILYVGFMALCVMGLRGWRRDLVAARPAEAVA
ncbi:nicotinamide riboside transporter PnuC [Stackebrandtia nassauensis]|uniref:Nicotinamide mononucleotide transporter PnuC n=1 Tax=Stackebrandtia nassauensis (strain DSM 44728 / CIP 108903 / NRRL B-16338 / NBRC 102104 / LLR-40K-21) TaxID=446470 RepID=D3Q586_STANL|nr:nicotinamide riboside transporter PnuC [Stackebrandtia nassauensis]ADD44135.1 nicotinamide mononucleotide transporter PnuC [Stackebrandtia nassauensis DSM 44728]